MTGLIKHFPPLLAHCKIIDKGILLITLKTVGHKQMQLVIIPPNTYVPDHTHPDVANDIQPLFGWAEIRKGDKVLKIDGYQHPRSYYIDKNELHGITTFQTPFVYLSTQYWQVEPTSIEANWRGEPLNTTITPDAQRKRSKVRGDSKARF